MKTSFINIFGLLILALPQHLVAATTTMELTYSVFSNTAVNSYPTVNFGTGTPAKFTFAYDSAMSPYFTGKVITDSNGVPIFGSGGIMYDTSVPPGSPMSNESRYNIIGNVTLEIDSHIWTGLSFNLIIYNNYPTVTPTDGLFFEFNLTPSSPFTEPLHEVQLSFSSNLGPLSLIKNTALPSQNSDVDGNDVESANFGLRPAAGGWVINSGSLSSISITTIPELSSFLLIWISPAFAVFRRTR